MDLLQLRLFHEGICHHTLHLCLAIVGVMARSCDAALRSKLPRERHRNLDAWSVVHRCCFTKVVLVLTDFEHECDSEQATPFFTGQQNRIIIAHSFAGTFQTVYWQNCGTRSSFVQTET